MTMTEPVTLLTDYVLGILSLALAGILLRDGRRRQQVSPQLWAAAFLGMAGASFAGGTYHGLTLVLPEIAQQVLWKATVYAAGLASFFLLSAALVATVGPPLRTWLLGAAGLKFLVYAAWMAGHDDFRYVVYDYAPSMLAVLGLQAVRFRHRPTSARLITAGIVVAFGAAAIQQSGLTLHRHFNHNDLYHVVQMGAAWLLYKGGRLLDDVG